jgi:hypothetical protein
VARKGADSKSAATEGAGSPFGPGGGLWQLAFSPGTAEREARSSGRSIPCVIGCATASEGLTPYSQSALMSAIARPLPWQSSGAHGAYRHDKPSPANDTQHAMASFRHLACSATPQSIIATPRPIRHAPTKCLDVHIQSVPPVLTNS